MFKLIVATKMFKLIVATKMDSVLLRLYTNVVPQVMPGSIPLIRLLLAIRVSAASAVNLALYAKFMDLIRCKSNGATLRSYVL